MPCYDKKLEAVRPAGHIANSDDIADETHINEVDAVIASHELADLFTKRNIDIKGLLDSMDDTKPTYSSTDNFDKDITEIDREAIDSPFYAVHLHSQNSNGYTEFIFKKAAKELFGVDMHSDKLEYKQCRNKDFNEVSLEIHGIPVMKFALAYGFRNIQNIVRNIKRKKCVYDYAEIMACPGGCLNGGGQIKPKDLGLTPAELLSNLIDIQRSSLELIDPSNVPGLTALYNDISVEKIQEIIKTYFTVIKTEASIGNLHW
jgi:iron only hydrogenase large subunit-like protein